MIDSVGIFVNPTKQNWQEVTERIVGFLSKRNRSAVMDAAFLSKHPVKGVNRTALLDDADMLISLGGDGTLLNLVGHVSNHDLPIVGVNLGGLGFLTEFTPESLFETLDKIIEGEFEIEDRLALRSTLIRNDQRMAEHTALNDVVITHEKLARLIEITAFCDEEYVTTYQADGLIICTATGSTAYSLSAGGPILEPTLDAILLTPICPHTITNRPILVPGNTNIRIALHEPNTNATMTIDGQIGVTIQKDDAIEVKRSPKPIKLVKCPRTSFFEVLRNKLGWSGSKGFDKA
jgi:NAD+ kinase